ncbi:MAG: right-handed parallel beta-helix repeat-containing protein [Candidatus Competibacteraceae bacterium]
MQRSMLTVAWAVILSLLLSGPVSAATLQVGPQRALKLPSEAAKVAKDGDIVAIDAGIYPGDVASWPQNRLTLRGVGGRARLDSKGAAAEGKAIWVLKGNDITVENIEFSGARVPDRNGAGIRFEGANLTIRNSYFHDNEMGILTGSNPLSNILIEGSEFNNNTVDYQRYGRLGHNIYIGSIRRFTLRNSYIHDAGIGHNVKSRAQENYILYNRIMDERNGSSYLVDLPDGGNGYFIGNLFHQSANTDNPTMIAFAAEHNQDKPQQGLYVVNNTFVNDLPGGIFVNNHSIALAILSNNLFVGPGTVLVGPGEQKQNLAVEDAGFKNQAAYDYHLVPGSVAIDKGIEPGRTANGFILRPGFQYVHPLGIELRRQQGPIDVGAYEFGGR